MFSEIFAKCSVLFCLYMMDCLWHFPGLALGAFVGSNFVGASADDIVHLAPSASALRIMLAICNNYAKSIRFHLMPVNQNAYSFSLEIAGDL